VFPHTLATAGQPCVRARLCMRVYSSVYTVTLYYCIMMAVTANSPGGHGWWTDT